MSCVNTCTHSHACLHCLSVLIGIEMGYRCLLLGAVFFRGFLGVPFSFLFFFLFSFLVVLGWRCRYPTIGAAEDAVRAACHVGPAVDTAFHTALIGRLARVAPEHKVRLRSRQLYLSPSPSAGWVR